MKIFVTISQSAALRANRNEHGVFPVEIDATALTPEEAAALDESTTASTTGNQTSLHLKNDVGWGMSQATPEAVMAAVRAKMAKDAKAKAEAEADRQKRVAAARAVLAERKTSSSRDFVYRSKLRVDYAKLSPNFDYNAPSEVTGSEEAQAWSRELAAQNEAAKAAANAELDRLEAEFERAAQAALADMRAWIDAHGSSRLKRCKAEGLNCESVYRDERLALDRPGWEWASTVAGDHDDIRNPSMDAFELLDECRQTDPDARLVYWTVEYDEEDQYDEDGDKFAWRGPACVAEFLGREIVRGVPDEFVG